MQNNEPGFVITMGKGFHMTFQNGYTVSVQWGYGNYCSAKKHMDMSTPIRPYEIAEESPDAEVAVWYKDGDLIQMPGWNDSVKGRCTPEEVLSLLNWAAKE